MALTVALTWVYLPSDVAKAATALSLVYAAASGITFRADKSFAFLDQRHRCNLARKSGRLLAGAGVVLVGLFVISVTVRSDWLLYSIGYFAVVGASYTSIRIGQLLAAGDIRALAWRNLAVPLLTPLSQLAMAPIGGAGAVIGGFLGVVSGGFLMTRINGSSAEPAPSLSRFVRPRELVWLSVSGIITPLAVIAPAIGLLLAGYSTEAGLLLLALRIGGLPATFTGQALGQAFVIKRRDGSLAARHWYMLGAAGCVWSLALVAGLSVGANLVLGSEWQGIGSVAIPAALVSCLKVVANPAHSLLLATGRSGLLLSLDGVRVLGCLGVGVIAGASGMSYAWAVWIMASILIATYAAYLVVSVEEASGDHSG